MNEQLQLIWAAKIADGTGFQAAPGAVLVQGDRVIATGRPEQVGQPADAALIDCRGENVIPALVNAHCHLDLTHIGPVPFDGSFTNWVNLVRGKRARSALEIAESVSHGVRLARTGGTAIIGDIAGNRSLEPARVQRDQRLAGTSFLEVFGLGKSQAQSCAFLQEAPSAVAPIENGVRLGLQPHSPYSCGLDVYRAAAEMNMPLATHLAETCDELRFVKDATGPLRDMLMGIGVWDDTIAGCGSHPLDALAELLECNPFVAAHLNYIEDRHLSMLGQWPITVAYCPRASAYFGHTGHCYRDMLAIGTNVALGTDSILCLDTPDRISVLDDMRLLHQRDGTDPLTLLRMATINGALGLGFDPSLVTLEPGSKAGLLGIAIDSKSSTDPMRQALMNDAAPRWIVGPIEGKDSWVRP